MNESRLVKSIVAEIRSIPGAWATKIHGGPYQTAGLPDILGIYRGTCFWLECKIHPNKPTAIQMHRIAELQTAGAPCGIVYTLAEARAWLKSNIL